MRRDSLFFLILFFWIGAAAAPHRIPLDNLNGQTQLLSVRCVAQDSTGRIWFGTDKSLYSYDGYTLRAHPSEFGRLQINALIVLDDKLLLCCNDGLYIYDGRSEVFETLPYFQNDIVRAAVPDGDYLYIGAETGLYALRWKDPESSSSIQRLCTEDILCLLKDGDNLWAGTLKGLGVYSPTGKRYRQVPVDLPGNLHVITTLYAYQEGQLWLGTPSQMLAFDIQEERISPILPLQVLESVSRYDTEHYLLATDNGLLLFDPSDGDSEKILEGSFWGSFTDREGDIWIATENGLLLSRPGAVLQHLDTGNLQTSPLYTSILNDSRGRLWIGSSEGLQLYVTDTHSEYSLARHYRMDDREWKLPHNRIKTVVEDHNGGTIYVATDAGLLYLDEVSGQFRSVRIEDSNNWIYDILIDGDNLWLATFEGLYRVRGKEVMDHFTTAEGLSTDDVAQLAIDRIGRIWILTRDQQVHVLDPRSGTLQAYLLGDEAQSRFADCLMNDLEGRIWIATQREIIRIEGFSEESPVSTWMLDPASSLEIYSMNDFLGQVFTCTSDGIFLIEKESGTSRHINTGTHYVCAAYDAHKDRILLGAPGEISFFPGEELDRVTGNRSLPVSVTSVLVNNQTELPQSMLRSGRITLSSRQNNLFIHFSDFNYGSEIPHRFLINFIGRRTRWTEFLSSNSISLPGLHPGRYLLRISTTDREEEGSEVLTIRIRRPWYSSWPMLILYMMALSAIVLWAVRFFKIKNRLDVEHRQREILLEQSKEKEAFFGNIAHEFKTPLSLIIGPLGKLLQTVTDPEDRQTLLMAQENAAKLHTMVHRTIDYYNETNQVTDDLIRTEIEFVEFAKAIFLSYKENFPSLEFIFDSSEPSMIVDVDVIKMEAVLNNLLSNACKYTPEGGSVILTLERDIAHKHLIIKVSDTGIGIPKDELQLIFQRYFESSRSKTGGYDSTGIGLSLIKKYIESHGGTVGADSDDNGSTFTTVIPFTTEDAATVSSSQAGSGPADRALVVIVDDNPQICAFLESVLKEKYRCITSNNGKSGLKLCKDVLPDLVIADVMMPVMDGLEMCRQIREYGPLSTIPIILLTAKGDKETENRSISLGIDSFVPKPFDLPNLTARVDQLIGNKQRMEQRLRLEHLSAPQEDTPLSYDERILKKVTQAIEEHIDDADLSVAKLCELAGISEKLLYRKLKQLTGLSTVEYIRSVRLKKAAIILQNGNFTVSEAMYSVGFSNASYFTRAFSAQYGKTPSEYLKQHKALN